MCIIIIVPHCSAKGANNSITFRATNFMVCSMLSSMRLVVLSRVSGLLVFGLFVLVFAQPSDEAPKSRSTRGDGLAAELKEAAPALEVKFSRLKEQAAEGNAEAQYQLSQLLVFGVGTPVDLKAAFDYAKKSAAAGYGLGNYHLGRMYRYGTGTEPDVKKSDEAFASAVQALPKLVEAKNTEAMLALALLYYRGWGGLEQDRVKALALNRQGAEQGNPIAAVEEADQYWDGKGTHRQRTKAVRQYRKIMPKLMDEAEVGDRQAQLLVGNLLATTRLGPRNFTESIKWHMPGAKVGYSAMQFLIGARHQKGNGMAKNDVAAMEWYQKAAAQGHPGAINNVGWMHGNGRAGGGENGEKASEMYLKAAQRGNDVSQNNIAMRLFDGSGIEQDREKAFMWHKRSAENDNGRGQYFLALRYDTGEGTAPDLKQAVYWYKRAAENDHRAEYERGKKDYVYGAQMRLAQIYIEGRGAKRDLNQALYWMARTTEFDRSVAVNTFHVHETTVAKRAIEEYRPLKKYLEEGWPASPPNLRDIIDAANEGDSQAQYEVGALHILGIGGAPKKTKLALEWVTKAANQGHAGALYYLGICNEEGRGLESNRGRASELYSKAAELGHPGASNNLGALAETTGESLEVVVKYYQKAAAGGSVHGSYNLARLKETDEHQGNNTQELIEHYLFAAKRGHAEAQNNLAVLLQKAAKDEKGLEEVARWCRNAANQGHANAQFNLGLIILRGQGGLTIDRKEVFVWWGRAALQDQPDAIKNLPALAEQMSQEEQVEGRKIIGQWEGNMLVSQLFVIREGD
jgi:TPR repeat protein